MPALTYYYREVTLRDAFRHSISRIPADMRRHAAAKTRQPMSPMPPFTPRALPHAQQRPSTLSAEASAISGGRHARPMPHAWALRDFMNKVKCYFSGRLMAWYCRRSGTAWGHYRRKRSVNIGRRACRDDDMTLIAVDDETYAARHIRATSPRLLGTRARYLY